VERRRKFRIKGSHFFEENSLEMALFLFYNLLIEFYGRSNAARALVLFCREAEA